MNIDLEPPPTFLHGSHHLEVRVSRSLSIPQVFLQAPGTTSTWSSTSKEEDWKKPAINSSNPEDRRHSYEFEKILEASNHPCDTLEDKAARDVFRPKRQYMSHQRRASLPTTTSTSFGKERRKRRVSLQEKLKMARKSFHSSLPHLDGSSASTIDYTLTPFQRQRKQHQKEEGALYAATRATERAIRSWKRTTIVLGPLGSLVQPDQDDTKESKKRRSSLLALLEKDASKHHVSDTLLNQDAAVETLLEEEQATSTPKEEMAPHDSEPVNEDGVPFAIDPQAVKQLKLREIFQKQNAVAKNKEQEANKARNILETKNSEDEPALLAEVDGSEDDKLRNEQLPMLTAAVKEPAASKEPALRNLVSMENAIHATTTETNNPSKEKLPKENGKKKKKRLSDPSSEEAGKLATDDTESFPKEDRRTHMLRRSSAPTFASTVAALTRNDGKTPEEVLKELSALPKHVLADIIAAPENTLVDGRSSGGEPQDAINSKKGKKKRKSNRRSTMKGSRRSSMPNLSKVTKEDIIYDWALAAKQKENNNHDDGAWKHIISDANAVRRPHDEKMKPLQPSNEIASVISCLPKLEALLPLVEKQKLSDDAPLFKN